MFPDWPCARRLWSGGLQLNVDPLFVVEDCLVDLDREQPQILRTLLFQGALGETDLRARPSGINSDVVDTDSNHFVCRRREPPFDVLHQRRLHDQAAFIRKVGCKNLLLVLRFRR